VAAALQRRYDRAMARPYGGDLDRTALDDGARAPDRFSSGAGTRGRIGRAAGLCTRGLYHCARFAVLLAAGFKNFLVGFALILVIVSFAIVIVRTVTSKDIAVQPISVPEEFARSGYTPEVMAVRLRDAVLAYADDRYPDVDLISPIFGLSLIHTAAQPGVPSVEVHGVGVSMGSIVAHLRDALGLATPHVSGELAKADGRLCLNLRYATEHSHRDRSTLTVCSPADTARIESLIERGALLLLADMSPEWLLRYGSTVRNRELHTRLDAIVARLVASSDLAERALGFEIWSHVLHVAEDYEEAIKKSAKAAEYSASERIYARWALQLFWANRTGQALDLLAKHAPGDKPNIRFLEGALRTIAGMRESANRPNETPAEREKRRSAAEVRILSGLAQIEAAGVKNATRHVISAAAFLTLGKADELRRECAEVRRLAPRASSAAFCVAYGLLLDAKKVTALDYQTAVDELVEMLAANLPFAPPETATAAAAIRWRSAESFKAGERRTIYDLLLQVIDRTETARSPYFMALIKGDEPQPGPADHGRLAPVQQIAVMAHVRMECLVHNRERHARRLEELAKAYTFRGWTSAARKMEARRELVRADRLADRNSASETEKVYADWLDGICNAAQAWRARPLMIDAQRAN
jgi:hypothetical protein